MSFESDEADHVNWRCPDCGGSGLYVHVIERPRTTFCRCSQCGHETPGYRNALRAWERAEEARVRRDPDYAARLEMFRSVSRGPAW